MIKINGETIKNFFKENKNIIKISVLVGFTFTIAFGMYTKEYALNTQKHIATQVIRFHVLANSDDDFDQDLKIHVKDELLNRYSKGLSESNSIDETKAFLQDNLENIEQTAMEIITEEGYSYTVTAKLEPSMFPTKKYGDVTLPAGEYMALKVEIGEAEGANWWCVMFPPLCFLDVTKDEAPPEMKSALKENLSQEEYELITQQNENNIDVKIKFKVVELWQELFQDKK